MLISRYTIFCIFYVCLFFFQKNYLALVRIFQICIYILCTNNTLNIHFHYSHSTNDYIIFSCSFGIKSLFICIFHVNVMHFTSIHLFNTMFFLLYVYMWIYPCYRYTVYRWRTPTRAMKCIKLLQGVFKCKMYNFNVEKLFSNTSKASVYLNATLHV